MKHILAVGMSSQICTDFPFTFNRCTQHSLPYFMYGTYSVEN